MERYRCCGTVFSSQLALVNHRRGAKCLRHLVRPAVPQRGSAGPREGCASPGAAQQGGAGGKGVGGVTHHTPPLHRSVVSPLVSPSWPPPPVVPSNKIDYRAVLLAMSARPGAAGGEHSEDCALGDEGYDRIGGVVSDDSQGGEWSDSSGESGWEHQDLDDGVDGVAANWREDEWHGGAQPSSLRPWMPVTAREPPQSFRGTHFIDRSESRFAALCGRAV